MNCKLCIERGQPSNFASEVQCAWPNGGEFNPKNWQCATANKLRSLAYEALGDRMFGRYCERAEDESIAVLWVDFKYEEGNCTAGGYFIVMTYYKDRGCTSSIHYALDGEVRLLTLKEAEHAIQILTEGDNDV